MKARSVVAELERWRPAFEEAIAVEEGSEVARQVVDEAREHIREIAQRTPDPGWTAPHMRAFTTGGMVYVAVYLALSSRGYDAARAWAICETATRSRFSSMRSIEKRLASDGLFSWPIVALSRWLARRSQRAPVGGWVFRFIEAEGAGFDYGIDYQRCAIREMAIDNGAESFAPYICLADISGSEIFGWGLARSTTLAQGGERCDFRFHRGGETSIRVRLPVIRDAPSRP